MIVTLVYTKGKNIKKKKEKRKEKNKMKKYKDWEDYCEDVLNKEDYGEVNKNALHKKKVWY